MMPGIIIYALITYGIMGVGVYCMVLFIKLARRGIKALDLYIKDKDEGSND